MTCRPHATSKRAFSASLSTFFVLASVAFVGCGDDDEVDRCAMSHTCFVQDDFGCCGRRTATVSVCEPCGEGQVEESGCRVSGCEVCEDICRPELEEAGCCGSARRAIGNASAGCVCPEGTVADSMCDAVFPTCGCGPEFAPMAVPPQADPLPPIPQPDAGNTGGPPLPSDAGAQADFARPRAMCAVDLGEGCCGDWTVEVEECGCRTGTIPMDECTSQTSQCYEDLGSGCCGAQVAACGLLECPEGSLNPSECGMLSPEAGGEPPASIAVCAADLFGDCCGDPVEANTCGSCPEDSVSTDTCNPDDCPDI